LSGALSPAAERMLALLSRLPVKITSRGRQWLVAYAECGDPVQAVRNMPDPPKDPWEASRAYQSRLRLVLDAWVADSLDKGKVKSPADVLIGLSQLSDSDKGTVALGAYRTLAEVHGLVGKGQNSSNERTNSGRFTTGALALVKKAS
jgi:hypothetical protein